MTSPWWTAEEAADYLRMEGTSRVEQLERLARSGKMKAAKRGRVWLFRQDWCDKFLMGGIRHAA